MMKFNQRSIEALGKDGWLKMYRLRKWWESEAGQKWLRINLQHLEEIMNDSH